MSADDVTTPSIVGKTVGRQVLNNGAKALLLDGRHCPDAMRQLLVEGDVGWLQQQTLLRLIVQESRVPISKAETITLSKLANKLTGILRRGYKIMDLMRTILNLHRVREVLQREFRCNT